MNRLIILENGLHKTLCLKYICCRACAYGIAQLVEKLIDEGADVNTTNSFGYTPMLEACHRGFQNIVELLVKGGASLTYIPSAEESNSSPFVSAPAQTALAESARCGFQRIVQVCSFVIELN